MNKSLSLNGTYLNESLPTIIFYHGGGYFVGSAGNLSIFQSNLQLKKNKLFLSQTHLNQFRI